MGRISVVVPIYNVEEYLQACLDSIARQTISDLQVVMVDDGGTDSSAAIAARYVERDDRFVLVSQPNGGLSAARNTGVRHASGEFLTFVDSDDVLPPNAFELLVGALEQSGSDFATGNVHRITRWGTFQANFLARTFRKTLLATHVTRFRPLLADRVAWNKLFRRSFWDAQGFAFPEGRLFEDTPVTIPAHFAARSVDVISDPVYFWRIRESGDLSITQRRVELRSLRDRVQAVEDVSRHLGDHGPRGAKRWYDESAVADDLRLYLNVLDRADDEFRAEFLERVNAFLDSASPRVFRSLPAIDRLKWHLVRRRLLPELLEVLRFQKEELPATPPVRVRRRWYGDYPFRDDPRLDIPASVYRLVNADLPGVVHVDELLARDGRLIIRGFGYVTGIGAPGEGDQRVRVTALGEGRLQRVRLLLAPLRLATRAVRRDDATAKSRQALTDLTWSGFEASIAAEDLVAKVKPGVADGPAPDGQSATGSWDLYVTLAAGGVRRRRVRFEMDATVRAVEVVSGDALVRTIPTGAQGIELRVETAWLEVDHAAGHKDAEAASAATASDADTHVRIGATIRGDRRVALRDARLKLRRRIDEVTWRVPLTSDGPARACASVSLEQLRSTGPPPADDDRSDRDGRTDWELEATTGRRHLPVVVPPALAGVVARRHGTELALMRTRQGDGALAERAATATLDRIDWSDDGTLTLAGTLPDQLPATLLLRLGSEAEEHALEMKAPAPTGAAAGRPGGPRALVATLAPAAMPSLAGTRPLREGTWWFLLRRADGTETPVVASTALAAAPPMPRELRHKELDFRLVAQEAAAIIAARDLGIAEAGPYHQRRLRIAARAAAGPLRDAVLYLSFGGRQYSDNPRGIHEELVRRELPLEHLWVARDGAFAAPAAATVLRKGATEYHEALVSARFVVANDQLPAWFRRSEGQVVVQTLHGHPLRRQGFDLAGQRGKARRLMRGLDEQVAGWSHLLSPGGRSTEILRDAYGLGDEVIETGLPRTDLLTAPGHELRRAAVRERLGIPDGARVFLYAPTYREDAVDRRGRFRLDLRVDLERLAAAAGPGAVVLFRKHPFIADAAPTPAGARIRDVSLYPDGTELLLAADVLITDYSSMLVDFAATGRPLLCFAYDLEAYEATARGFYVPFEETVPGPLLRSADELWDVVADPVAACAPHAERRAALLDLLGPLDDGAASARVADAIFT